MAVGTAGLRAAGNRDEVVAAIEAATGVTVDTISGRGGEPAGLSRRRADLRSDDGALVVFDTGGGSTPVHLRPRRRGRRPLQRRCRRGALHRALRARRGGVDRDARRPPWTRSRPIFDRLDGTARARRAGRHGRCDDEHHRREARPRPTTTPTPSRGRPWRGRTSTVRSSCTGPRDARRPSHDRGAPAAAGRRDPRRGEEQAAVEPETTRPGNCSSPGFSSSSRKYCVSGSRPSRGIAGRVATEINHINDNPIPTITPASTPNRRVPAIAATAIQKSKRLHPERDGASRARPSSPSRPPR